MGDDDDVARYRSCYKHCNGKPALDLTPEYMYAHSTVAPRLAAPYVSAKVLDGVRTIALVREPVTRFAAALDLDAADRVMKDEVKSEKTRARDARPAATMDGAVDEEAAPAAAPAEVIVAGQLLSQDV